MGCKGFKAPESAHCLKHTCPERGCKMSTRDHQYCDARKCHASMSGKAVWVIDRESDRCDATLCQNPKGWKENRRDRNRLCPLRKSLHTVECSGTVSNAVSDTCRNNDCQNSVDEMQLFCTQRKMPPRCQTDGRYSGSRIMLTKPQMSVPTPSARRRPCSSSSALTVSCPPLSP